MQSVQRPLRCPAVFCRERQQGMRGFCARTRLIYQPDGASNRFAHVSHANRRALGFGQLGGVQKIEGVRAHDDRAAAGGGFD